MPDHPPASVTFVTTQWTRVLEAQGDSKDAKAALGDLCAAYYAPVFAFIRRKAPDGETARDLTQGFFLHLLEHESIGHVEPRHGRFRSYLLGAVKHFLADVHDRAHRLKRGGGQEHEPLLPETDTSPGLEIQDPNAPSPEREFDRKWALILLDRALVTVAREHERMGKLEQFQVLKDWLTGDTENVSQANAAHRLGLSESAVKVAIHRLRRRFRDSIKSEIAQTVRDPIHIEAEMKCLFEALR